MTTAPEVPVTGGSLRKLRREQRMTLLLRLCEGVTVRDWRKSAACRGASDPELFALDDVDSGTPSGQVHAVNMARHEEAIAEFCNWCPVRLDCLAEALELGGKGTWGAELLREEDHLAARRVRKQMYEESL